MGLRDNLLLVEGKDDLRLIPELVERAGVPWGPPGAMIVRIHETDGYEKLAQQQLRCLDAHGGRLGCRHALGRQAAVRRERMVEFAASHI